MRIVYGAAVVFILISIVLILARNDIENLWLEKLREEKYELVETTFFDQKGMELGKVSYYVPVYSRINEGTLDMHDLNLNNFHEEKYEIKVLKGEFSEHRLSPFLLFWKNGNQVYISTAPESLADAGVRFNVDLDNLEIESSWSYERFEGGGIGGYISSKTIEPVAGGDAAR